jgi:hypothetical protein
MPTDVVMATLEMAWQAVRTPPENLMPTTVIMPALEMALKGACALRGKS